MQLRYRGTWLFRMRIAVYRSDSDSLRSVLHAMPARAPLPRICIAMGFNTVEQLIAHARREAQEGESFFEFRLDYLPHPEEAFPAMREFLRANPQCTVLATCRRHQNHGNFQGSIEEQLRVLEGALDYGASAVDVEIETAEQPGVRLDELRTRAWLIVSWHHFEATPALAAVMKRMLRITADAYKVVTTARKPSDIQRVLSIVTGEHRTPMIVLTMGEIGFPTRVLSPLRGGLYTYAAPNCSEGTASGQVSARHLRHLYRIDRLTKEARVYGVIADPVRHSLSPVVHNRAFQQRRMDAVYLPFLVEPRALRDFVEFAAQLPVSGFSVTIPHKQKVLRYLDVIDPLARRIGAVNTVWRKAGKWRGTNTDARGVTGPLSRRLRLSKASVLLVGNGGAARGAAFALCDAGVRLSLTGRNPDRVRSLARVCGAEPLLPDKAEKADFDVVVHATPLGMHPKTDGCFFPDRIPGHLVFDMVYNPLETTLLKHAAEQGAETIAGSEMFLEQATAQFEIWTGESAPRAAMERALMEALAGQH
jgi:3-dehydroquinate dehydratase/shikimate dehydrogenase